MEELTPAMAVELGGWDARYAVVLVVVSKADIAAALVDPNGDGGDIDLDQYELGPDGRWVAGSSSGSAGDSSTSWSPSMVAIYGRTDPHAQILIDYAGETQTVDADGAGWWLFIDKPVDEITMPGTRTGR